MVGFTLTYLIIIIGFTFKMINPSPGDIIMNINSKYRYFVIARSDEGTAIKVFILSDCYFGWWYLSVGHWICLT
jgi:hypothetical protein